MHIVRLLSVVGMLLLVTGCKTAYYGTWEKLGWAKRDILVDRVEDARDEQEAAKEQFKTTLERFQEVTNFQGGDLEAKYKKLSSEYEGCKGRAEAVNGEIESVETVANDMFAEWKEELKQYSNEDLRKSSEAKLNGELKNAKDSSNDLSNRIDSIDRVGKDMFREWTQEIAQMRDPQLKASSRRLLRDTERRHRQLMAKMREVEERMEPVIRTFEDRVLFLKHNLNARAIRSLKNTNLEMDRDVTALVSQIDASIAEADAFIDSLKKES